MSNCVLCHAPILKSEMSAEFIQSTSSKPTLDEFDANLAAIEAEIKSVQAILGQLTLRHKQMQQERNLSLPVHRIPVELLAEIFAYSQTPFLVAQVSRQWRDVALSTPTLWENLEDVRYEVDASSSTAQISRRSLTDLWLARSKDIPLRLALAPLTTSVDRHTEYLASCTSRWKEFSVHVRYYNTVSFLKNRVPLLNTLNLTFTSFLDDVDELLPDRYDVFSNAPALRHACICYLDNEMSQTSLPWSQLQTLRLEFSSVATCIEILTVASNLQRLEVCYGHFQDEIPPRLEPPFVHPFLQSLSLQGRTFHQTNYQSMMALLVSFTFPNLDDLTIDGSVAPDDGDSPALISFLVRTNNSLQKFTFNDATNWMSLEALIECLALMPGLTELHIETDNSDINDFLNPFVLRNLLDALIVQNNSSRVLCPRLRIFGFDVPILDWLSTLDLLLAMVESRKKFDTLGLENVNARIVNDGAADIDEVTVAEAYLALARLRAHNVAIVIHYHFVNADSESDTSE